MSRLDDVLKAARNNPGRAIFVSRSGKGVQPQLAIWIGAQLEKRGYTVILQDWHFADTDFMMAMDGALASGARVLALMSRDYLDSRDCMTEATNALRDAHQSPPRLVILNIDDCQPMGVLRNVVYVRFLPVWQSGDATRIAQVVIDALERPESLEGSVLIPAASGSAQIVHPEVLRHDEQRFAGREADLARLRDVLFNGAVAALTRAGAKGLVDEAALAGMGGVGKTTLARAYAFRNRPDYHGVWWVRAETNETLVDDLIALGSHFIAGLESSGKRDDAARLALSTIAAQKTERPWLLVYDNAAGPGVLASWRPEGNAHVLVTSRHPDWDAAVPLDVFTPEAAVEFLCEAAQREQAKDRDEAAALAKQLGYLPLALSHAASKCRGSKHLSFADYGRRIAEFWRDRPAASAAHGRYGRSVFATFTLALDEIVAGGAGGEQPPLPEAETVLGVLAHLDPEQVPMHVMQGLHEGEHAVMSEATFDRALERLAAAGLVLWGAFEDGDVSINVHRLVQDVMRARLGEAGRLEEVAALTLRLVQASFAWNESAASAIANGRWLPHAYRAGGLAAISADESQHTTWTCFQIGNFEVSRGSLERALAAYEAGRTCAERLAASDPGNSDWQRDLGVSYSKIGDVLVAQGRLQEALKGFRDCLAIVKRLAVSDPENEGRQRDVSVAHTRVGDVLCAQGQFSDALNVFRDDLAIAKRLATSDPENAEWQRDLSVSYERVGAVLVEQGQLPDALKAFRDCLAIRERLAGSDPGNAEWQRDLSVSLNKVGGVLAAEGQLPDALKAFRDGHAIAERLAASDPGNAGWQRDLSVSYERVGDVLLAQGRLPDALTTFRDGLAIRERLARADPGNAVWQRDLSFSFDRLAGLLEQQGNRAEAIAYAEKSVAIDEGLAARDPTNVMWQEDVKVSRARLARLKGER